MSEKDKAETSHSIAVTVSDTSQKTTTSSSSTESPKREKDEQAGWNLGVFEDKNPFSGFSEEHMNKLDEFLSSEEARKILQQTSEGDFTPSMAELDSGQESTNTSTDELLLLDMFEVSGHLNQDISDSNRNICPAYNGFTSKDKTPDLASVSGYGDHAYALPSNHAPKSTVPMAMSSPTPGPSGSPATSPRKSNRIAIRKERIADVKESLAVSLAELTAIKKDEEENAVSVTEDVGTSTSDMESVDNSKDVEEESVPKGRGRGRGRRSAASTEPSPLSIRRSTRIGDIEQREMAEKIRQENRQKEKEALEALKKKEEDDEDKTPAKKGKQKGKTAAKVSKDDDEDKDESSDEEEEEEEEVTKKGKGKGKNAAVKKKMIKKKGKKDDSEDDSEEEEDNKTKKGKKKQPAKSKTAVKGKRGKKGAATTEESEDEEETKTTKKGKKGKKAAATTDESEESETEEESKEDEEETEADKKGKKKKGGVKVKAKLNKAAKRGRKRKAKNDEEGDTPKKKKKMSTKGKKKKDESESEEEEATPTKKMKGKKGKVLKGKKKKGKVTKEESDDEDKSPKGGKKKGKKGPKGKGKKKGKKETEDSDDDESENETPKKGQKKGKKTRKDEDESEDDTPKKGRKKGKKAIKDEHEEVSEDETPKKGRKKGKKAGKDENEEESEDETPKKGKKKGKKAGKDENEEESEDETPKKGKKKGKKAGKDENEEESEDETPKKGKKKGKKAGKDENEDESEDETPKKGKNKVKKKGKPDKNDDDSEDDTPKKEKKKGQKTKEETEDETAKKGKTKGKQEDKDEESEKGTPQKGKKGRRVETAEAESPQKEQEDVLEQSPKGQKGKAALKKAGQILKPGQDSGQIKTSPRKGRLGMIKQGQGTPPVRVMKRGKVGSTEEGDVESPKKRRLSGKKNESEMVKVESVRKRTSSEHEEKFKDGKSVKTKQRHSSGSHRIRHDSVDSKQSDESQVERKTNSFGEMTPKPVRRKSRKSEEIIVDPSVMDLFKPDGVVLHDKEDIEDKHSADQVRGHVRRLSEDKMKAEVKSEDTSVDKSVVVKEEVSLDVKTDKEDIGESDSVKVNDEIKAEVKGEGNEIKTEEFKKPLVNVFTDFESANKTDKKIDLQQVESHEKDVVLENVVKSDVNVKNESKEESQNVSLEQSMKDIKPVSEQDTVKSENKTEAKQNDTQENGVVVCKEVKVQGQQSDITVESKLKSEAQSEKDDEVVKSKDKQESTAEMTKSSEVSEKVKLETVTEKSLTKDHSSSKSTQNESKDRKKRSPSEKAAIKSRRKSSLDKEKESKGNEKEVEGKRKRVKKSLGADMQEHEDSGDNEDDLSFEDDEADSDYEPPDMVYCICRQPHGNRFMICCDKCEDWFHGNCVGITRAQGKKMEENKEDYICPICTGEKPDMRSPKKSSEMDTRKSSVSKDTKAKGHEVKQDHKDKKEQKSNKMDKDSKRDKSSDKGDKSHSSKSSRHHSHHKSDHHRHRSTSSDTKTEHDKHRRDSDKHVHSKDHRKSLDSKHSRDDRRKETSHLHHQKTTTPGKGHTSSKKTEDQKPVAILQKDKQADGNTLQKASSSEQTQKPSLSDSSKSKTKEKRTPQPCVVCKKEGLLGTVYCGDECLTKHVDVSLKNIHQQQEKQGTKNVKKTGERKIVVLEKKSGRILTGLNAPTEAGVKEWLQQHPTFEILCPTAKPSAFYSSKDKEKQAPKEREKLSSDKGGEKPSDNKETSKAKEEGPDPVRINVRKSLRDALTHRASKADDVMLSNSEIKSLALSIEEELFRCFKETNHKYKAKYRSLIFNIKDSKNQGLFRKILAGNIKPHKLVKMTPEELASKELARWREYETKHNLAMIELTEKEHMKEHTQIVKKTHKGEVTLEEEDLSTLENRGSEVVKPSPAVLSPDENKTDILSDLIIDTTSQHKKHLFDLNCRICTGKMAPPQEDPPPSKKVKVVKSIPAEEKSKTSEKKFDMKKTEEEQKKAEEVVKEVLKAIQKAKSQETPVVDSTVTVGSPDSALQSGLEKKPKFTPSGPQLWKGFIFMQDVAKFVTSAYRVSGPADRLDLPDTIHVCGRIAPEQVWDYLSKMKKIGTRDICILRFIPGNDEEKTSYINLYSYLNSRARCGVVGNCAKYIKDFYILPLASHSKIPSILKPFDGPGLEENRPHMLLAVIVKQKLKRHSSSTDSKHSYDPADSKKSRSSHEKEGQRHPPSGSNSFTPPMATQEKQIYSPSVVASSSKGIADSKLMSPLITNKEHRATPTSKQTTPSSLQTTPSTTPSSSGATPVDAAGRPLAVRGGTKDPIVAFYGSGEVLPVEEAAVDDAPYSPGAEENESDDPYDPENALFDRTKTPPSQTSVSQMIEKMAKTNSPAEMTAIMVTSLATASTLKDKQLLLLELTQKVKEQKDLLEAKRLEKPASVSTPTPAFAMNTLSSAISAITAVSKQLSMAAKKHGGSQSQSKDVTGKKVEQTLPAVTGTKSSVESSNKKSLLKQTESVVSSTNEDEKLIKKPALEQKKPVVSDPNKIVEVVKEKSGDTQAVAEVPEALQSLFCSIPGNYSHITNFTKQEDVDYREKNTEPEITKKSDTEKQKVEQASVTAKQQQEIPSVVKKQEEKSVPIVEKKEKGFNVKLLAFDYGDSDSESGEEEKKQEEGEKKQETGDSQQGIVLIPGIEVTHQKPEIKPLPRSGMDFPLPERNLPLPEPLLLEPLPVPVVEERIQPPLPPEPPPPPPDHAPDEEEEESSGKKGKGKARTPKPPPEIVLQPTDPIGKVILEMSFHKIQQEMTVPAPPLPPLPGIGLPPVMSGPPSMPMSQAPLSIAPTTQMGALPMLPPAMTGAPLTPGMPAMDGSGVRNTVRPPHMAPSMPPMGPRPSVPHGDVMSPSIQGPRMSMGHPPGRGPVGPHDSRQHHMSPDGPGFGRGKKRRKTRKNSIPSLFDINPNPSRKNFQVNWQGEEMEEEEWSLDQDLRQQAAEDQDLRTQIMDRDDRIRSLSGREHWEGTIHARQEHHLSSESTQDVDHRLGISSGQFKAPKLSGEPSKVPMPQALEDKLQSLPPLPLPSEILEDSDMRKFPPAAAEDCDYRIGNPASVSTSSSVAPPTVDFTEDVDLRPTNLKPSKTNKEPVHKKQKLDLDSVKEDVDQRSPKLDIKTDQVCSKSSSSTQPFAAVTSQTNLSSHTKSTSQSPVLTTSGPRPAVPHLLDSGPRAHGPPPARLMGPPHMRMPGGLPPCPPRPPQRNQPAPPGVDDWE